MSKQIANDDWCWKPFSELPCNPYQLENSLAGFRCLLVFPTQGKDLSRDDYPIAFGYFASLLRMNGGHADILVYDVTHYEATQFSDYDLICFYPMTASFERLIELPAQVKRDNPNTPICFVNSEQHQHEMILCTPKAHDFGVALLHNIAEIDFVLIGEAEAAFVQLCDKLARGNADFETLPACLYRKDKQIKTSTGKIQSVDFEYLPYPARDHLESGINEDGFNVRSPRIQSARGCVAPCLYCVEASSNITAGGRRKPLLRRSVASFIDEIELLQAQHRVFFFNVIDSSFEDTGSRGIERMESFCDEMLRRDIHASFKIHLRAETVCKLSDEQIDKLKRAGVDIIGIGVESGLKKELKSYKKIASRDNCVTAVKRLYDTQNFYLVLGHMMFSPVLELDDLTDKINFLDQLGHCWDYLEMSNNVIIFPGTAYHDAMKRAGLTRDYESLATSVPYNFVDKRVELVASEMGALKIAFPSVVELTNLLYDSQNILSRYRNPHNAHLQKMSSAFEEFRSEVSAIEQGAAANLKNYFLELIECAHNTYTGANIDALREQLIAPFFPEALERARTNIHCLLSECEETGLTTSRLYLKTWMSIINTQVNTAAGKGGSSHVEL